MLSTPRTDVEVLRTAAVYGANASGKSNLLQAMRVFSSVVSNSQRHWKPTGPVPTWDPFVLDNDSRRGNASFEIDFALANSIYTYGFEYNSRLIVSEWLIDCTQRDRTLFRRTTEGKSVSVVFPGKNLGVTAEDAKHLESISAQTRANSLFLSAAAQNNFERLTELYAWLTESFFILSPRDTNLPRFTAELCSDEGRKRQIQDLLRFADVGIVDISIETEEAPEKVKKMVSALMNVMKDEGLPPGMDADAMPEFSRHSIKMFHKGLDGDSYPLSFEDESAGTRAFFYMIGPLLSELKDGTTVLVDELESSLHPNLAKQLVRIFSTPELNPNGAQLVFATHDVNLLDLTILRRDQIWFAQKSSEGSTSLVKLSDFKPRKDQDVASAYLNGRFGSVPLLDEGLLRAGLLPDEVVSTNEE